MQEQEKKEFYKRLLIEMSSQMADLLADGKAIEVDKCIRSVGGMKLCEKEGI